MSVGGSIRRKVSTVALKELVTKRFTTVERPTEPSISDYLKDVGGDTANVELSPQVREGLIIQARLVANREAEADAQWLAAHKAQRDAAAAYDAALLRKIDAR